MLKVVAPMAGITDAEFLNSVIPIGFNVATLGGYSLDEPTITASRKIIERGRAEFDYSVSEIFNHIRNEAVSVKNQHNVKVSVNVRSATPKPVIDVGNIKEIDIVEINCHCRQEEITSIGCGQAMLKRDDLSDFISRVVDNADSEVSVKLRANTDGADTLNVAKVIENAGADYIHVDAMMNGVCDADYELLRSLCEKIETPIIGNNSVNSSLNLEKMIDTGVTGFSIARALISHNLDFDIKKY